jgi:hypothetical protein
MRRNSEADVSQAFARIHIHLIFSTRDRKKLIPKEVQPELWSYMAGIFRNHGIATNGN